MSDNWFDTAEKIYFFSSFNWKNTYILTKLAQSTRHLVSAPHSVSQHHKVRVTQASSTHLLLPSYRKRPSTLFLSPAALLYANFVFCHVKFPSFSSVSENDPPHHACARDSKLLLKHEILEHMTFQMTRPSEQSILSRLANPTLWSAKAFPLLRPITRPILSRWMCVLFHVWMLHVLKSWNITQIFWHDWRSAHSLALQSVFVWVPSCLLPIISH